jgi:hypothetical protein
VTYSSKQLLLVGRGPWSTKIATAIAREDVYIKFEVISARSLLNDVNLIPESAFKYVWLCARPDLQSKLLSHLSGINSIFILEKPFAVTESGFSDIHESKAYVSGRVRQSRVWKYSPIWQYFMANRPNEITKIEIKRGGPVRNSVLPPPEDWISHDLYLLTDLFGKNVLPIEIKEATCKDEKLHCVFSLKNASVVIHMSIGKFNEKCANWTIHSGEKAFNIDFLASTYQEFESGKTIVIEGKDAIHSMLSDFENVDKEVLDIDWNLQKLFVTKVLVQAR